MGEATLAPGQWKVVNATGDDLSKSIYPLPSKEPSAVLMQLMNLLIQSGNQLASIAEIFVGKMPGQNTPATTTQETVQQSMAVFTAIYKRVYRSLDAEFKKLYRLNALNTDIVEEESKLSGVPMQKSDYDNPEWMIVPGADPTGDATTIRMEKMQAVGQLLQFGHINVGMYSQMMIELLEIPDGERLIQPPPPPQPDPKAQALQMKAQIDQQKAQSDMMAKDKELQIKERMAALDAMMKKMELMFKQQEHQMNMQQKKEEGQINMVSKVTEQKFKEQQLHGEALYEDLSRAKDLAHKDAEHQKKMQQNEQSHQQKQKQKATTQKARPKKG